MCQNGKCIGQELNQFPTCKTLHKATVEMNVFMLEGNKPYFQLISCILKNYPVNIFINKFHADIIIKLKRHYFFSMHERMEFCKSCNLIGSGSRQNFSILPADTGMSLCHDLKFPFFDTKSIYIQKCFKTDIY